MAVCDHCGNEYDKSFQVMWGGPSLGNVTGSFFLNEQIRLWEPKQHNEPCRRHVFGRDAGTLQSARANPAVSAP
jgi:hypothetical protein